MNIKSTVRTIMYYVFTILSILGFCVVGSIVDIKEGGSVELIILAVVWFACIGLAVFFYDYRIYDRVIFAVSCVVLLIHGFLHKKTDTLYLYLYDEASYTDTIPEFFYKMLNMYDEFNPGPIKK